MTGENEVGADDRMIVAYFSDGADAYRAINELIDEGFGAADIGAAFRTRVTGSAGTTGAAETEAPVVGEMRGARDTNPEVTGSVGGAGSHDEAVTPAGLAPGSGNAFPSAARPGPIPGGEVPGDLSHELPHDLPSTLPSKLPSTLRGETAATAPAAREEIDRRASESASGPRLASSSNMKFGTGEGHLGLASQFAYSEPAFEGSFVGMGLGANEARSLSSELSRGGAIVTVNAAQRASLAEAILERNHGRVRLEKASGAAADIDRESPVEIYGSMRNYYRRENEPRERMAS